VQLVFSKVFSLIFIVKLDKLKSFGEIGFVLTPQFHVEKYNNGKMQTNKIIEK